MTPTGIDHWISGLGAGHALPLVLAVAVLLGLRHATDPDHLAAVSTLIASNPSDGRRKAGRLGLAWGLGHATTLLAFGVPIVLYRSYLPASVDRFAELLVGLTIAALAVRLLRRVRRTKARLHSHAHGLGRSPVGSYAIGLVHGIGGSGGVGVLLLAGIPSHAEALIALLFFALAAAVSMTVLSCGFGCALAREAALRRMLALAPALALMVLMFGVWYSFAALSAAPPHLQ